MANYFLNETGSNAIKWLNENGITGLIPDEILSPTSERPLQNKAILEAFNDVEMLIREKQDALFFNTEYDPVTNKVATMKDVDNISGFITKDYLNIWDVGVNSKGSFYKVAGDIYYAPNKKIADNGQPQFIVIFARKRRNHGSFYVLQWDWICFNTDADYEGSYICTGSTNINENTGADVLSNIYSIESQENKVLTLSSESTDNQYPSAKAVYDYVQSALYVDENAEVE